jgi:hypothetical protein
VVIAAIAWTSATPEQTRLDPTPEIADIPTPAQDDRHARLLQV